MYAEWLGGTTDKMRYSYLLMSLFHYYVGHVVYSKKIFILVNISLELYNNPIKDPARILLCVVYGGGNFGHIKGQGLAKVSSQRD